MGNLLSYLGHTLAWEKGRQLKSFDGIQYTYNANGIRTSKTVNGVAHTYTLDGTKILRETWGGNTLVPLYDNEDSVCGVIYNGEPFYFFKNLQGDIIAIADKNAQVVAKYSYDAWGVCTVEQDASTVGIARVNPFRYRGYYFDAEIGMYYLQSRYYDPAVGRFVNADDVRFVFIKNDILNLNQFTYCKNNPIYYFDQLGTMSKTIAVGGVVVLIVFVGIMFIWYTYTTDPFCRNAVDGALRDFYNANKRLFLTKLNEMFILCALLVGTVTLAAQKVSKQRYRYSYFEMNRLFTVGKGLNYNQALARVRRSENVLCIKRKDAEYLANVASNGRGSMCHSRPHGLDYFRHYHPGKQHFLPSHVCYLE